MVKKNVYYASSCALVEDAAFSQKVNIDIVSLGYNIYTPALNEEINDKTRNPTPRMIYDADMEKLENCDILLVNINGGHQDGTIYEVGVIANENSRRYKSRLGGLFTPQNNPIYIIPFTRNTRLLDTQIHNGIASASVNHLVLGALERWSIPHEFTGKTLLTYEEALLVLERMSPNGMQE